MNHLKKFWLDLNSSLWFLPAVIVAVSIALAVLLVELDKHIGGNWISGYPRLFGVEPAGSRDMLSAIAGSMITVAGIVFSIVIVALSLASTQYTPRILRNFMRDQINQTVLGAFVGIFTYCIVVLRTIRGGDDEQVFVPSIGVFTGILLALVGIGFLIYFIHHIAVSIQASSIIAAVYDETIEVVEEIFPHRIGENAPAEEIERLEDFAENADWRVVNAAETGYIQNIDIGNLLRLTSEEDFIFRMEHGVGEFVVAGSPLASVAEKQPNTQVNLDEKTVKEINALYAIDNFRTIDQDAAFGIRQIVDILMKALSPGINDTTTAVISIDYLTAICAHLAAHEFPSCFRFQNGRLHVVTKSPSFEDLVDLAFNQTRQNATNNVAIILRILHALEQIYLRVESGVDTKNRKSNLPPEELEKRKEIILRHLQMVVREARENVESKDDWAQIAEHTGKVAARIGKTLEIAD